jgi:hypothetical protein
MVTEVQCACVGARNLATVGWSTGVLPGSAAPGASKDAIHEVTNCDKVITNNSEPGQPLRIRGETHMHMQDTSVQTAQWPATSISTNVQASGHRGCPSMHVWHALSADDLLVAVLR